MATGNVKMTAPSRPRLSRLVPYLIVVILLAVLPPFLPEYTQSMMTKILIFAILAMSLDILWGYTGLTSLGHAAYFGVGGYTAGLLMLHYHTSNLWLGIPLSIVMAALVAALFGLIALRVTGFYFIFVTLALGQLIFSITWKWKWLSSMNVEGIVGIPYPSIGIPGFTWNFTSFYYLVLAGFVICFLLLRLLVNSPFGYALQGIRESEPRMRVLGYNTWLYKYIAFTVAGAFAGFGGALFAYHNGMIAPDHTGVLTSALALFMIILGGPGTLYGPVVGAAIIIPLEFYSGVLFPARWPLVLGGGFVLSIMFARRGVAVYIYQAWRKVARRYGSAKS